MKRFRWSLIIFVLILTSCTQDMERVAVPSIAPMEDIARIAIVGVENFTADPSVGRHFEQIVATILDESGVYEVVDATSSRAALARLDVSLQEVADPSVAAELAHHLNVDALVIGSANYYFEDTYLAPPHCIHCNVQDRPPLWTVTQTTTVVAAFEAKVVHAHHGETIWANLVEGRDTTRRTFDVSWSQSSPPPTSLLPRPARSDIPETRNTAIRQAARQFTADLLPRYVWVRKEESTEAVEP